MLTVAVAAVVVLVLSPLLDGVVDSHFQEPVLVVVAVVWFLYLCPLDSSPIVMKIR